MHYRQMTDEVDAATQELQRLDEQEQQQQVALERALTAEDPHVSEDQATDARRQLEDIAARRRFLCDRRAALQERLPTEDEREQARERAEQEQARIVEAHQQYRALWCRLLETLEQARQIAQEMHRAHEAAAASGRELERLRLSHGVGDPSRPLPHVGNDESSLLRLLQGAVVDLVVHRREHRDAEELRSRRQRHRAARLRTRAGGDGEAA